MTNSDAGYTLVELVVALLLLGMISLAVESGLHFGATVWSRSWQSIEASHELDMGQSVMRGLLAHSLPRLKRHYVTFTGEPKTLVFDAVPPQAFQSHGMAHVAIEVVREVPFEHIKMTMTSLVDPAIKKQVVIGDKLKGIKFSYLDDSGRTATWLAYWRDRSRLPTAIRIAADDPADWPDLIVHPLIAQTADCALDPVSMTCRSR